MAKVNSIAIGKAKGSIGNVTFRTRLGDVIASQKVGDRKGQPGTYNQVARRVMWPNLVNAYKALNSIDGMSMHVAFPRASKGESAFNAFIRKNIALDDVKAVTLDKATAETGFVCPAPFIFSEGTLRAPDELTALMAGGVLTLAGSNNFANMGELSTHLIENYHLEDGDVLTMVNMQCDGSALFYAKQITIDSTSTAALPAWISSAGVITVDPLATRVTVNEGICVRGRISNGVYEISSAQFGDSMTTGAIYMQYTSAAAQKAAMESYGYKPEPYLQSNPQ